MDLDYGAVQAHRLDLDAHDLSMLHLFEYPIEHPILGPAVHTCVDGVPIAEALGQSAPFAAMLGYVQDGIEHTQIGVIYVAALLGQAVLDLGVLLFADFHSLRSAGLDLRSMP